MRGETGQLLSEDPDLGRDLDPARLAVAEQALPVRVMRLGAQDAKRLADGRLLPRPPHERGAGFLVLDGLLLRRVGLGGRYGAELLGSGDLLRPWQGEDDEPTLAPEAAWRVLSDCRLAVLDVPLLVRLAHYPEVTGRIVERALKRSRHLAILISIIHQPRLEIRLHMLLWQLAGRWGRVGPDGIRLHLRLPHSTLAELVAARRPSVTTALSRLSERGLVLREDETWLLTGGPPTELTEMGALAATGAEGNGRPRPRVAPTPPAPGPVRAGSPASRCAGPRGS